MDKLQYKRMYETRNVRPYYTIMHLGVFGHFFKEITGFEYKNTIYITSSDMNNTGYFDVDELKQGTEYFRKFWMDEEVISNLIKNIRERFAKTTKIENESWSQNWSLKDNQELIKNMKNLWETLMYVSPTMIVSQPQHVLPLEEKINKILEGNPDKENILLAATYWDEDLPWAKEEKDIEELQLIWENLSINEQNIQLQQLVDQYGWFNDIEGDKPFDVEHYRKKVIDFKKEKKEKPDIEIPKDAEKVGSLIGELGFLRFWNRYHFMTVRYHLKNVLLELVKRSGRPELEFATTFEIEDFFAGKSVDIEEIKRRMNGYSSYLENGKTKIVTGKEADELKELVKEDFNNVTEVKGNIANKGNVIGKVRIISFVAKDYNEQVAAFKQGEVLITGMTRPQIVHLCRMAAAIVTDEGGITSHAAVIGREFGLPCVIGTHNATKVFKTGDMVEVDANQGIIRKII